MGHQPSPEVLKYANHRIIGFRHLSVHWVLSGQWRCADKVISGAILSDRFRKKRTGGFDPKETVTFSASGHSGPILVTAPHVVGLRAQFTTRQGGLCEPFFRPFLGQCWISNANAALIGHNRIGASTRILTQPWKLYAVVAHQRTKNIRILRQILLSESRHNAAWIE